jgi:hypothetical protein
MAKTQLQHVVTAAAINLLRIAAWKNGTPIPVRSPPISSRVNSPPLSMLGLPPHRQRHTPVKLFALGDSKPTPICPRCISRYIFNGNDALFKKKEAK